MKKAINNVILTVLFAVLLSGCGAGNSDAVQDLPRRIARKYLQTVRRYLF